MSTVLEETTETTHQPATVAHRLREATAAMKLSFNWFGTRKSLSDAQKSRAAASFGAEGEFLSAGKKLIDTRHPRFKAVTSIRSKVGSYFKGVSLPFPEPGVRLIRRGETEAITGRLERYREELATAATELDAHFEELKSAARIRLGALYNLDDYPASLMGAFAINWEFPSVEAPEYLRRLSPELYRDECRRVQGRFDEAIQLAEQAFLEELEKLVSHLQERLAGQSDGRPKVFRDSAVHNFTEFFERFRQLNIGSSEQLDDLVSRAQRAVGGVAPQQLRDNSEVRQQVTTQLGEVHNVLDDLLVDRPRRRIQRNRRGTRRNDQGGVR